MARVICPECLNVLEHDRGYLPLHMRDVQRGQLVTGSQMCPLSNTKLVTERKKIEYNNTCDDCGIVTEITVTEEHPGSFDHIQPFLEVNCIGCSVDHDGHYCENQGCGLEVTQREAFFRVSDSQSKYIPSSGPSTSEYLDLDTEAEAAALIETWPDFESGRYNLDAMPAGWYDNKGNSECRNDDPMAPSEHAGRFKPKYRKTVLITDGFVIHEQPDEARGTCPGCAQPLEDDGTCSYAQMDAMEGLDHTSGHEVQAGPPEHEEASPQPVVDQAFTDGLARLRNDFRSGTPLPGVQDPNAPTIGAGFLDLGPEEISDSDIRQYLQSVGLDPKLQSYQSAQAVATHWSLPIAEASQMVSYLR